MTRSIMHHVCRWKKDSMCMWGMSQISMPLCKEYMEHYCSTGARIQHKEYITKCEYVPLHSAHEMVSVSLTGYDLAV